MGPLAAGLLVAGASSALENTGNFLSTNFFSKRNEQWAREDATTAFERERQLLHEQQDWESPASQMQRFKDAGLNPNLVYGQMSSGPSAPSVPQAHTAQTQSPQMSLDLPYIQARLAEAQVKNLESQSDLSQAQAYRIYKITPIEFQKIQNDSDRIRQMIQSDEFRTSIQQLYKDSFDRNALYLFTDENGNHIETDMKSIILDSGIKQLYASNLEYNLAIKTFLNKVGISNFDLENKRLENKDLSEFVKVCARIYESEAKQADYIGAISELNQSFFGSIGASNEVIKLVYSFLSMVLGNVGKLSSRSHKK